MMRGWEIALRGTAEDLPELRHAVSVRALRLHKLGGSGTILAPEAQPGSKIDQDDAREWGSRHGDLTVQHQARSRLFAACDHLAAHAEGWCVRGRPPPFHIHPEFTVLRGALEATAVVWWLLEPEESRERVLRALAAKKKEAAYEAQAADRGIAPPGGGDDLRRRIGDALEGAASEVSDGAPLPKFPSSSDLADHFGEPDHDLPVGRWWRECSSYAHGFDWAHWHHREGMAVNPIPAYRVLARAFVVACDALQMVWTELWLPLALETVPASLPPVFLPMWPQDWVGHG